MKKQMIAASMAAALTLNMAQMAFAAETTASTLSREQLMVEYAKGQVSEKTLAQLKQTRDSIKETVDQLNKIQGQNISDPILRYSTQAQSIAILGSSLIAKSGIKELHDPRVTLSLQLITVALNKFIKIYSSDTRVDAKTLSDMVKETSDEMLKANPNNQDIIGLSNLVRDYSTTLITNQNDYVEATKAFTGISSDGVLVITAAALLINFFAPKLAAEVKVVLKEGELLGKEGKTIWAKISPILANADKTKQVTRQTSHGTTGSSSILDLVSMIAGMNNQKSISLISATQGNLVKTLNELNGKIGRAEGKE